MILIIVIVVIGIAALLLGIFLLRAILGVLGMTLSETGRINDDVFCIKERFVNTYIFKGKQGYLMIDAGMSKRAIKTGFDRLGIDPEQVTDVLLTHADHDHINGLGLFKNAKIYMHRDEEQMINGKNGKFPLVRFKWKFGPYTLFDSNQTLSLAGLKIEVFHAPGHTPGSCSFLVGSDYLAAGDHLGYRKGKFGPVPSVFNMDTRMQETTLKALPSPETIKYVLTSHYGVFKYGKPWKELK